MAMTAISSLGLTTLSSAQEVASLGTRDSIRNIDSFTQEKPDVFLPLALPSYPAAAELEEDLIATKLDLAEDYKRNLLKKYSSIIPTQALDLIKEFEGFRASAYIDTDGTPVIGYGLSRISGKPVRMGDFISPEMADAELTAHLTEIRKQIHSVVKVNLNDSQFSALASLSYNVGFGAIERSTLVRKLNAGDYNGAANEFLRWDKANVGGRKVRLPGLTRRRQAERNLFLQ